MADNSANYKLLVSDFDGTLAGTEHTVTSRVEAAVKRWISSGRHFTIATGRQYMMIVDECKRLGLTTPVVVRGGAEIFHPVTDELIDFEYLKKEEVEKIRAALLSHNFTFLIEHKNVLYSNFRYTLDFADVQYKELSDFILQDVPKFVVKATEDDHERVQKILDDIETHMPTISIVRTHGSFGYGWDITSVKATKLHGILTVMEYLNVKREEVIGVGDSYNDFPLLEAAGLKVAMGNAHLELKEIADMVVSSNEHDGIAELINKLLK